MAKINKFKLFLMLRKNIKLSEKRSVAYQQNKTAKIIIYLMSGFAICYMLFLSVMLALIANETDSYTASEFFFGLLPFFLVADFFFRFIGQQTPAQLIKPYSLMPIPRYTCVELFLISSVLSSNNLLWLAITVPYVIMTMIFSDGILPSIALVFAFQIVVSINSQWYLLVRTLINRSMIWWALPLLVYAAAFSPIYLDNFDTLFDTCALLGTGLAFGNIICYAAIILILLAFVQLNKRVQYHFTYMETANVENVKMKHVADFAVLNRYGEIGEYLKLEVKSLIRNKNMRKSFIFATAFVMILSLVISFTDIYQDNFSRNFWVVYNFVLYGAMMLIKIMSSEGNYIDGLMIHKENILQLITAKYYFYSTLLIMPFILMLPTVFTGKYSLLMLLSMIAFTIGPVYCLLMQMAVYNRQTTPLNSKFISKGNVENNYFQIVAELIAMFCPVIFISILKAFFSENVTFVILLLIGLIFISLHKLWLRNIYQRFMSRRYKNMESFRATR